MPPEGMSRPLEAAPSGSNSGDPWQRPMTFSVLFSAILSTFTRSGIRQSKRPGSASPVQSSGVSL